MLQRKGFKSQDYFLLAVSNKVNLDLCLKHALAGFPNTLPGVWAFSDISEGDYVSLLYGATAHNLYRVERKYALKDAEKIGPWPSIKFRMWNKTYYFPFRLQLEPIKEFKESLIRIEFAYVGENLLLRGGYRKTHFQADHLTLLNVSSRFGLESDGRYEAFSDSDTKNFVPVFLDRGFKGLPPESFRTNEIILQSIIRRYLKDSSRLQSFLNYLGIELQPDHLEILGEKALQEGIVDILIKELTAVPASRKIAVEVKTNIATMEDLLQIRAYVNTLGKECLVGVLIAGGFRKQVIASAQDKNICLFKYDVSFSNSGSASFENLIENFRLSKVQ